MEHQADLSQPERWRTTAIVAAALAAFELVLLVVIALAFLGSSLTDPATEGSEVPATAKPSNGDVSRQAPKAPKAPVAKLSRSETAVIVLNGNGRPGAAGEAADLVRTKKYVIAGVQNAPRTDFARTIVMFRPGYRGEAIRLARDLRLKGVAPLDGLTAADLQGAHLALVVGAA